MPTALELPGFALRVDFSTAIAVFLSLTLFFVFLHWIIYNFYREEDLDYESRYFVQCPYCSYIFFHYSKSGIKHCPRCQSYIGEGREHSARP